MRTVMPGRPYPLGAVYDGTGVNFALIAIVVWMAVRRAEHKPPIN